jgi:GGDEF domain-containing protein
VRFFVHFARLSNINLVAEGIETAEELATVVSVGVRFAQGFFLARPASRSTISTPDFANEVRAKWRIVEQRGKSAAAVPTTIAGLAEPVAQAQLGTTLGRVRELLRQAENASGVLAMDQRRVAGWVWKSSLDNAIDGGSANMLLGEIMSPHIVRLPSDTPIVEALEVACVVDDQAPADPILVADGQTIRGIVRLRDLIRLATRESGTSQSRVTVLPSRVEADRHVAEMIKAWRAGQPGQHHADAVFVDIRRFADYNAAFGYAVGDRMIRSLADMIDAEIGTRLASCFVAHLSDDRFLITAPPGELGPRLYALIDRFEEFATTLGGESLSLTPAPGVVESTHIPLPRPSLRVLLLDGALQDIATASELYRLERQLRDRCRLEEQADPAIGSRVIIDERARAEAQNDSAPA